MAFKYSSLDCKLKLIAWLFSMKKPLKIIHNVFISLVCRRKLKFTRCYLENERYVPNKEEIKNLGHTQSRGVPANLLSIITKESSQSCHIISTFIAPLFSLFKFLANFGVQRKYFTKWVNFHVSLNTMYCSKDFS